MKYLPSLIVISVALFFSLAQPAYAQFQEWGDCVDQATGVATLRCIPVVFNNLIAGALMFVGVAAVIMLVWGGFKMVNSGGDPKQTGAAKQILTYAVIGVVLVLGSFAIIYFIGSITGTSDCITNFDNIKTGGCK